MNDVILKPLEASHLELVRAWRNSPEVASYMYSDEPIGKDQQIAWFQKLEADKSSCYWIIYYDEKPLGVANLAGISPTLQSCYWAFYLGDTSVRGGGVGAKVEYQVLHHVFEELKLNKLRCEVFTSNEKVIQMHEKFGFRREAYYREHCKKGNEFKDVVGLAMLKSEWLQQKDTLRARIYRE